MKLARNPDLRIRREQKGYTLYLPIRGAYWLNETSMDMFLGLTNNEDEETIVDSILSKYGNTDRNEIQNDLRHIISVLKKTHLIVESLDPRTVE
jgi:hypothetical protein